MLAASVAQADAWRSLRTRLLKSTAADQAALLQKAADESRRLDIGMIHTAGLGHIGGDLSVMDILTALYVAVLRVDPEQPDWVDRDRLILSKGHCAGALYVTLAQTGFFPRAELGTFMAARSALNGHPDRNKVPGVETNTGPLGHGLPVAVGAALAARLSKSMRRVFVVLGDGELQEGSNWEAMMAASHYELENLVAVVDRNGLQQGARTESTSRLEPLADKWRSFGWHTVDVDGHDHLALIDALAATPPHKPTCIIAKTIKGKGVSFMEDRVEWHHKVPTDEELGAALAELSR
jgi:transketolase